MKSEAAVIAGLAASIATGASFTAGSEAEHRVIEMMSRPGALLMRPEQLAKAAGISRQTLWKMRQNPAFAARYRAAVLDHLQGRMGEVVEATIQSALIVGRDGASDRRLLFEAAGLIKSHWDKTDRSITGMTDAQLLWWYQSINLPRPAWAPAIAIAYDSGRLRPEPPDDLAIVPMGTGTDADAHTQAPARTHAGDPPPPNADEEK